MLTEQQRKFILTDETGFFSFINGLKARFESHPRLLEQFAAGTGANAHEIIYALLQALQCRFATKYMTLVPGAASAPALTAEDICRDYKNEFAALGIQRWFDSIDNEITRLQNATKIANHPTAPASREEIAQAIAEAVTLQLSQRQEIYEVARQMRETNFQHRQQIALYQAQADQAQESHRGRKSSDEGSSHASTSSGSEAAQHSGNSKRLSQQFPISVPVHVVGAPDQRRQAKGVVAARNIIHVVDEPHGSGSASSSASSSPDRSGDPSSMQIMPSLTGGRYQEERIELPAGVLFIGRLRRYFAEPGTPGHRYNILIIDEALPKTNKGNNGFGPGKALYDLALTNHNPAAQQAIAKIFGREVKFHYLSYHDATSFFNAKNARKLTKEADIVFAYPVGERLESLYRDLIKVGERSNINIAHTAEQEAFAISFRTKQLLELDSKGRLCFPEKDHCEGMGGITICAKSQRVVLDKGTNQQVFRALLSITSGYMQQEWAREEIENEYLADPGKKAHEREACSRLVYPVI